MTRKPIGIRVSLRAMVLLFAIAPLAAWYWWQLPFETESVITTPPEAISTDAPASSAYYRRQVATVRRGRGNTLLRHGPFREYDRKGELLRENHWQNDRLHGSYRVWTETGELLEQGEYLHGERHGDWQYSEPAPKRAVGGKKIAVRDRRIRRESYDNGRPVGVWTEYVVDATGNPGNRITRRHHEGGLLTRVETAFRRTTPGTQPMAPVIYETRVEYFDRAGKQLRVERWHGDREWLVSDIGYDDEVRHGASRHLYADGQPWITGQWLLGRPAGVWKWWSHPTSEESARTWHNTEGQEIQARLAMASRDWVRLEMRHGSRDVSLDRLCEQDRQFVMRAIGESTGRGSITLELEFDNGVLVRRDDEPVVDYPLLDFSTTEDKHLQEALGQSVTLEFSNETLGNVAAFLSDYLGTIIFVHESALSHPITVDFAEIPVAAGLYLMLEPHGLTFDIRHDVLTISTPGDLRRAVRTGVSELRPSVGSSWERALMEPAMIQATALRLDLVVTQLAARHGVRISMSDPVLRRAKAGELNVTFSVNGVSLRSCLGMLLERVELSCKLTDERVFGDRSSEVLLIEDLANE